MIAFTIATILRVTSIFLHALSLAFPKTISLKSEIILLVLSSFSLILSWSIIWGYIKGGHRLAEKRASLKSFTGLGLIVLDIVAWGVGGGIFLFSHQHTPNESVWHMSCHPSKVDSRLEEEADLKLLCRLQVCYETLFLFPSKLIFSPYRHGLLCAALYNGLSTP
jgi:hypothetical protein